MVSSAVIEESGDIQNFKREGSLQVSHLLYADDMLVFCRANDKSFTGVMALMKKLTNNTGLYINKGKSKIYFSKGCTRKEELCAMIGINEGKLPVRYLGLPLFVTYPKARNFLPLIDKLRAKVDGWSAHMLNFEGRIQFIRSVLFSYLTYWYQTFNFPYFIAKEIERIMANFLWKGKMKSMSWVDICRPKSGGFGIRRVKDMCIASGLKMIWRLHNSESLWACWMKHRYLKGNSFGNQ